MAFSYRVGLHKSALRATAVTFGLALTGIASGANDASECVAREFGRAILSLPHGDPQPPAYHIAPGLVSVHLIGKTQSNRVLWLNARLEGTLESGTVYAGVYVERSTTEEELGATGQARKLDRGSLGDPLSTVEEGSGDALAEARAIARKFLHQALSAPARCTK